MITDPPDDTRARILDLVEELVMERGFNAVSYQDVSDRIGIRKASVHYHFPAKADLGAAVIRRYADKLATVAVPLPQAKAEGYAVAFERALAMFAMVAASHRKVCLAGVLGAEFETLPEPMQAEVRRFYLEAQGWLAGLLAAGRRDGAFHFTAEPEVLASAILSMMEGALIVGRALSDPGQLAAATATARSLAGLTAA